MKKNNFTIILIISLCLVMFTNTSVIAISTFVDFNEQEIDKYIEYITNNKTVTSDSDNSINDVFWDLFLTGVDWVISKISGAVFYREPDVVEGPNWCQVSTGSLTYGNDDDDIRRVRRELDLPQKFTIDAWAQTDWHNWLEKINIWIEDEDGYEVAGANATHNQHVIHYADPEYYELYYSSSDGEWDHYVMLLDFTEDSEGYSADKIKYAVNSDGTKFEYMLDENSNKHYVLPSGIFNANTSFRKNVLDNGIALNARDLYYQFYDSELKISVNALKDFDVGDSIIFEDTIKDIKYDHETNSTKIYFDCLDSCELMWPFNGDLTEKYVVDDSLRLKFEVVEEYSEDSYVFENLDYILEGYKGVLGGSYPELEDYIIEN